MSNTIVFHCLYFCGGSMVKGWHLSRASTALSISACCFADRAGTSKRGGDASVRHDTACPKLLTRFGGEVRFGSILLKKSKYQLGPIFSAP